MKRPNYAGRPRKSGLVVEEGRKTAQKRRPENTNEGKEVENRRRGGRKTPKERICQFLPR